MTDNPLVERLRLCNHCEGVGYFDIEVGNNDESGCSHTEQERCVFCHGTGALVTE